MSKRHSKQAEDISITPTDAAPYKYIVAPVNGLDTPFKLQATPWGWGLKYHFQFFPID